MRTLLRSLLILFVMLSAAQFSATAAQADKRVALVLGISAYQHVAKLPNPSNDADAIAALFRKSGFDVVETKRDVDGYTFYDGKMTTQLCVCPHAGTRASAMPGRSMPAIASAATNTAPPALQRTAIRNAPATAMKSAAAPGPIRFTR